MENNDVINALKRLQRAGSETSQSTEKLHEAVRVLASHITRLVPDGVELPRGYRAMVVASNVGGETFLTLPSEDRDEWTGERGVVYVDGLGGPLHGDFRCEIPAQTRKTSLAFAADVADGWLDELAAWLEARGAEDKAATERLQKAAGAMR